MQVSQDEQQQQRQDEEDTDDGWNLRLPTLSRWALIKVLIVLAYLQMLIQQLDNKEQLDLMLQLDQPKADSADHHWQLSDLFTCCDPQPEVGSSWWPSASCIWQSEKLCSAPKVAQQDQLAAMGARLVGVLQVWLARWRSPVVQRLAQSMLVQVLYVGDLLNRH